MQLTVWTYEGPPHVGAMRIATAMEGLHYVLHAPQGDTYADLLFTMIERRSKRPPVTYTTFQARDLGSDTAQLFQDALTEAATRFRPQAIIAGASCTAELIQDDPAGLAEAAGLDIPVIALELPSYSRKENWGAAETFYQLVRRLADAGARPRPREGRRPSVNLLGPTALGFRHRDDVAEVTRLLDRMGIAVNLVAPLGASPADLKRIGEADCSICLYPEIADTACRWVGKTFGHPIVRTVPIGHGATRDFIREVAAACGIDPEPALAADPSRMPWWSRSVDSTYLTAKRVFIFGDATHAIAAARVASKELGFEVVGLGCYNREFARDVRAAAATLGIDALITDDYLEVERAIADLQPELVLGTQMERHIAKRLNIPCAVISAPVHVQDFPARYSPQMGWEGANVLFDSWVHPLVMGLEEHLLHMFRDDFEFHDGAGGSHLGGHGATDNSPRPAHIPRAGRRGDADAPNPVACGDDGPPPTPPAGVERGPPPTTVAGGRGNGEIWTAEAEAELRKIPFFVRGKARRNTESFAAMRGIHPITLEALYDAKSHFSR